MNILHEFVQFFFTNIYIPKWAHVGYPFFLILNMYFDQIKYNHFQLLFLSLSYFFLSLFSLYNKNHFLGLY